MKQQEANQFLEGLNLDTSPIAMSNQQLSYALNATMITKNGNEMVLQNDMGNGRVETAHLPAGYVPVGVKEHGGIVYVASYNPLTNQSQIGSFPSPERNISQKEQSADKDLIFGYFSVNDEIQQLTMKLQLTEDVLRPGDKFSIDMFNYSQLVSLLKHINNGSMTLDVAILNSAGGLVKLDYMNDLSQSGVVKYTYEGMDTYIRYASNRYSEEDIKYNVLKSKIIGELFLQLTLNVPESIPYEVTAYSYIVENTPISKRKPGYVGYIDITLPKYYSTTDGLEINKDLQFITQYKIKTDVENIYDVPFNVLTGDELSEKKAGLLENETYEFQGGHYVRIYYTQEDVDNENLKVLEITPYFEDTLDIPDAILNSGWLPMLKRTISINPAKVGKGEVYLSEFRYFNNIKDGYMTLNYSFESYLRKHEYVKELSLVLLPYEDLLDSEYVANDKTTYQLRPDNPHVGGKYYIKIPLKSNRKNYFGNFQEMIQYEDLGIIKSLYTNYDEEIEEHNQNLYKKSEGFCAFQPGQSYIGCIEVKTEQYTNDGNPKVNIQHSKPLAIFTCEDINDLYFNSKLNTFIRGDISNTGLDDKIVIPSSLRVGFLPQHNRSTSSQIIQNVTNSNNIKELQCYGDMDQTDFDPAALIRVKDYRKYDIDYSLNVSPSYNVTNEFPIGVDVKVEFLNDNSLQGQRVRDKATINGNPLYYSFTNADGESVIIDTTQFRNEYDQVNVSEKSEILNDSNQFAKVIQDSETGQTLLHVETFELPSVYYGIALRQDDYYVEDVSMLRSFNDNWEEGPLLGGCVYGDHSEGDIPKGRHYMAAQWINLKAWENDDDESQKSYDLIFSDQYDPTFWAEQVDENPNHDYYWIYNGQHGSYYPDSEYKLALNESGGYARPDYAAEGTGAIAPDYSQDSKNRWKLAVDSIAPKGLKYWINQIPIIQFWQGSAERDGSLTPYNAIVTKLMKKEVGEDQFSNFCIPILKDSQGYNYALNEWGYASVAISKGSKQSFNIRWKETYLDQLYRTFGYCFGRQDHITENILFKKVCDDEYDTYTNPYQCRVNLALNANINIATTHYDNKNRAFNLIFENDTIQVSKIKESDYSECDHPIIMPEIAVSDTDKVYSTGNKKLFTLPTLYYSSANFKDIASKFYNFEPGNYTLLKDQDSYSIFYSDDGTNQLFNINQIYFKGYSNNKLERRYYSAEVKNTTPIVYGKTILHELKDDILKYKRDRETGWYGLTLGRNHKLLVGGKSNLGDNNATYDNACNFGLYNGTTPMNGHDDLGEAAANFSRISNMAYISNARLLDDFTENPSLNDLHCLYDYRLKDTVPSIVYGRNLASKSSNFYTVSTNIARQKGIDIGDETNWAGFNDVASTQQSANTTKPDNYTDEGGSKVHLKPNEYWGIQQPSEIEL